MQKRKELALKIGEIFEKYQPVPETELDFVNPYELIVSVILSAQCTDKRVNLITPALFDCFPTVESLANAEVEEVFALIKSCSYPNNKAKHLVGMANTVMEKFKGKIPETIEKLQKLPGVGRKTANVVASVAFNQPTMPVDTHVFRVAQRIGLAKKSKTALQVEEQLVKIIPKEKLHDYHHWLILHGRYICQARKPKCEMCPIVAHCNYFKKNY
ncbi:MAG: endonuclease III [Bacteroidetes bacterium]|nr:endonuclease III [Bacteroidota bacterium]